MDAGERPELLRCTRKWCNATNYQLTNFRAGLGSALQQSCSPAVRAREQTLGDGVIMASVNAEEFQKVAQESIESSISSLTALSKGLQAITVEVADYSKKSLEAGSATVEKLLGVKSLDKAIEVQTDYLKSAYEGYVAEMTKVGELYVGLAKDAYKPYEGLFAKVAK